MLAQSIATASLLLLARDGAASAETSKTPTKIDFMRAMDKSMKNRSRRLSEADFKKEVYGNSKKSSELRKKIIEKSVVTKTPGSGGAVVGADGEQRKLQNYQYDAYHDGTDDYLNTYGSWENKFGFDVTQYSASYHRCAEVKQFDDELAAQEDTTSVFATKHFAVFRLCPEATCLGFQEQEADCGCSYQCADVVAANGGDSDECEASCATQCTIWTQQYSMYNNGEGRKLQNNYDSGSSSSWDNYKFAANYEVDEEVYGARGEGCQSNYGEYMLEVKEYLEIMLEWQEHRYEEYEEYCETCMYKVYQQWLKNGGDRRLAYEEFKSSEEHRNLGGYYGACPEYDTCAQYQKIKFVDNWSGYFECTEVQKSNGQVAYVGPHCANDGFTISLGVYSDENCYEYIGNGIDISSFGISVGDDALKSYYNSAVGATFAQLKYVEEDTVCIPCNSEDIMWNEEGSDNGINELCAALYQYSARCDKHYRVYSSKTNSAKYADAIAAEDLTCDFIDSVIMGNYNEMGFVNLGTAYTVEQTTGYMADNLMAQKVNQMVSEVTPMQVFGLIASLMVVSILGVWAASLHNSLSKGGPWRPRRGFRATTSPTKDDLDRQNSGIVLGRSASNTSYYMS